MYCVYYRTVLLLLLNAVNSKLMNSFIVPIGNDVIPEGQPYTVSWDPSSPGPVYLQLSYGDNLIGGNITASTSNSSSYSWIPNASNAVRDDYFLVICDVSDYSKSECSYTPDGRFSLVAPSSASSTSLTTSSSLSSTASSTFLSSSSTSASSQTSISSSSTQTLMPTPTVSPSPGWPVGAKVAIDVIIPIFTIVAVVLALLLWKRSRAQYSTSAETYTGPEAVIGNEYQMSELPDQSKYDHTAELQGDPNARVRAELPVNGSSRHVIL